MYTVVAELAWIGAVLGVGVLAWGCGQAAPDPPTSRSHELGILDSEPDTGLVLRTVMLRDTVTAGETAPAEVVYVIVNGPRPTLFDNHPGRFRIVVTGPDRQPAKSLGGAGPASGVMGQFDIRLPANGSLIQRQDLRCVNDAAYSTVPFLPSKDECLAMYALEAPGRYQVIVEYFGPELDSVTAGVHLADTAAFVVAAR